LLKEQALSIIYTGKALAFLDSGPLEVQPLIVLTRHNWSRI